MTQDVLRLAREALALSLNVPQAIGARSEAIAARAARAAFDALAAIDAIDALPAGEPAAAQPPAVQAEPLNGIKATMFHDEGAIAQCQNCKRYTLNPKALADSRQPVCDCGKQHYWSGSFKKPGPDAQWFGAAPTAQPAPQAAPAPLPELRIEQPDEETAEFYFAGQHVGTATHDAHGWDGMRGMKDLAQAMCAALATTPQAAPAPQAEPEFTDNARGALLWVLWHHQGSSSPVGQPLRFALGMGQHEPLTEAQIAAAKGWAALTRSTTADFHNGVVPQAAPAPLPLTDEQIEAMWSRAFSDGSGRTIAAVFARAIERAHGITATQAKEPAKGEGE